MFDFNAYGKFEKYLLKSVINYIRLLQLSFPSHLQFDSFATQQKWNFMDKIIGIASEQLVSNIHRKIDLKP